MWGKWWNYTVVAAGLVATRWLPRRSACLTAEGPTGPPLTRHEPPSFALDSPVADHLEIVATEPGRGDFRRAGFRGCLRSPAVIANQSHHVHITDGRVGSRRRYSYRAFAPLPSFSSTWPMVMRCCNSRGRKITCHEPLRIWMEDTGRPIRIATAAQCHCEAVATLLPAGFLPCRIILGFLALGKLGI